MVLKVEPTLPNGIIPSPNVSASKHVIRKRLVEIRAENSSSTFSYDGTQEIVFDVNSPSDFWECQNSYVRLNFKGQVLNDGSLATSGYLAEGGVHSLFRSVVIETTSGVLLQRIDRYNKLYAIMAQATMSPDYIDNGLFMTGDSTSMLAGARVAFAQNTDITLTFQPFVPLLQIQSLPLMLIRGGLRIRFQLERPEFVFSQTAAISGTGLSAEYTISKPVYMCSFVQPDESLASQFLEMYNGQGLIYNYLSFKHFLDLIPAASTGISTTNMYPGVRSAKAVIARIQNHRAETASNIGTTDIELNTLTADSIAQGIGAGLVQLHYSSGSERFPTSRPMDLTTRDYGEAQMEAQRALNHVGMSIVGKRASYSEYGKWGNGPGSESGNVTVNGEDNLDAIRFFAAVHLSRDSSHWAGLDLSLNPLQGEYNFGSAYVEKNAAATAVTDKSRYIHQWVMYDTGMILSANDGIVVLS